jgi:transposase-like protein
MKVTKRYNQSRRDLSIDTECESCGATNTHHSAYDDRNFWDNVVPSFKCPKCGKSTKDLGLEPEIMPTKYPEGMQV